MASWQLRVAMFFARHVQKPYLNRIKQPFWARLRVEVVGRLFLRGRWSMKFRTEQRGGVTARIAQGQRPGTVLYLHGGAYILFSAHTHQGVAAGLAKPLGLSAAVADYVRAPEHPLPAALDDAEAVYLTLAHPVMIAGDSAGGGLALALLQRLLAKGSPLPACVVAFSPWTDLTCSGDTIATNAEADPLLPAARIAEIAQMASGQNDRTSPDISPLFGDFNGAPPILIQVADNEILLADAERMAAKLRDCGGIVTLDRTSDGFHAFQMLRGWVPEADAAILRAVEFAKAALSRG